MALDAAPLHRLPPLASPAALARRPPLLLGWLLPHLLRPERSMRGTDGSRLGQPENRAARRGAGEAARSGEGRPDLRCVEGSDRRWAGQLATGAVRSSLIAHPQGGVRPVWWLGLPFTRATDIPNLNRRQHWAVDARLRREWREAVALLARSARIPAYDKILVALHYAPAMQRRRDPDNLVAALKPAVDGLVDAGVVPDDTPEWVTRDMPIIEPPIRLPDGMARLALYIERIR